MRTAITRAAFGVLVTLLLVGLPLLGVVWTERPVARYLEFPPLTRYVDHAAFSWTAFVVLACLILAVVLPFDRRVLQTRASVSSHARRTAAFPWWGWLGAALCTTAWVFAWTRFDWFRPLQRFTFSPLWLGYILVVNALAYRGTGACMMTRDPVRFLLLFPLSAAFWWFFEYLNRFVQNWAYVGVTGLNAWEYVVFATLPFSTVLPAVLGTYELLASNDRIGAGLDDFLPIKIRAPRVVALTVLVAACAGLSLIGVWPDVLFPLLWVSPLLIIVSIQAIAGRPHLFSPVCCGRWRRLYLLAMAALICGFFWEMWNVASWAKWVYDVPYVGGVKIFEMPILGYAGYLPFGMECAVVAEFLQPSAPRR